MKTPRRGTASPMDLTTPEDASWLNTENKDGSSRVEPNTPVGKAIASFLFEHTPIKNRAMSALPKETAKEEPPQKRHSLPVTKLRKSRPSTPQSTEAGRGKQGKVACSSPLRGSAKKETPALQVREIETPDRRDSCSTLPLSPHPGSPLAPYRELRSKAPPLPLLLIGYLQLFFNCFVTCLVVYFIFRFVRIIQRDVFLKINERLDEIRREGALCRRLYIENKCMPGQRVPAMEKACLEWESKMNRDPSSVRISRVFAETLAEILNGFFEPISYKTLVSFLLGVFVVVVASNYAFGYAKKKAVIGRRDSRRPSRRASCHSLRR
ncbi:MAG: nuclear envelope protein Brr6/Brl1 [Amphiamblys sp. WSBS2006]|nr:MAG: nuclear envelope protein Brr6/Brl1 [Amphiamblys sp. WSBS2006]